MIKKRSIGLFFVLSIITLGIYPIVAYCIIGKEVNQICEGDGKNNMHFLLALLLGFVTFGIYTALWYAKAMNRLQDNAYRYGPTVRPVHSGNSFLLWMYLGSFVLGIGPFVAVAYFLSDLNQYAGIYGSVQPLKYTDNQAERAILLGSDTFANVQMQMLSDKRQNSESLSQSLSAISEGSSYEQNSIPNNKGNYESNKETNKRTSFTGVIRGVEGMYSGYNFPIEDNEEICIGTNPYDASIVIDINNQLISSQHCIIRYDAQSDSYLVKNVSQFGTFTATGERLSDGMPKIFQRGEKIYLGDQQNVFRLG